MRPHLTEINSMSTDLSLLISAIFKCRFGVRLSGPGLAGWLASWLAGKMVSTEGFW